jgi:hypothetical protein
VSGPARRGFVAQDRGSMGMDEAPHVEGWTVVSDAVEGDERLIAYLGAGIKVVAHIIPYTGAEAKRNGYPPETVREWPYDVAFFLDDVLDGQRLHGGFGDWDRVAAIIKEALADMERNVARRLKVSDYYVALALGRMGEE